MELKFKHQFEESMTLNDTTASTGAAFVFYHVVLYCGGFSPSLVQHVSLHVEGAHEGDTGGPLCSPSLTAPRWRREEFSSMCSRRISWVALFFYAWW